MIVGWATLIDRPCMERSQVHPGEVCSPSQISDWRFNTNVSICSMVSIRQGLAGGSATQQVIVQREVLSCHSIFTRLLSVTREPRARVATDRAYGWREPQVEVTAGREPQTEVPAKGKLWWLRPKQSSRSLYIQSTQLAIDRQAWVTTITGSTQLYPFHCTLHCCLTALLPCYLHLTYCDPSCCPLATSSYYTGPRE